MRKTLLFGALAAFLFGLAGVAWAQNSACNILNCQEQGGSRWSVAGSIDVLSGGDLDIESGGALKLAGTQVTSTAAELNIMDGVTATAAELNDVTIQITVPDISTLSTGFVVSHFAGTITDWYCALEAAITAVDAVLTLEVNGSTPTTGSSLTVAWSGSAAGDIDSDTTVDGANTVAVGQLLSVGTNGASTNTAREICTVAISR